MQSGDWGLGSTREEQGSEGSLASSTMTRATADPAVTFSDLPEFKPSAPPLHR